MEMQFLCINPTGMVGTNLKAMFAWCLYLSCRNTVVLWISPAITDHPEHATGCLNSIHHQKMGCPSPIPVLFCTHLQIHHFCGKVEVVSDLKYSVEPPKQGGVFRHEDGGQGSCRQWVKWQKKKCQGMLGKAELGVSRSTKETKERHQSGVPCSRTFKGTTPQPLWDTNLAKGSSEAVSTSCFYQRMANSTLKQK